MHRRNAQTCRRRRQGTALRRGDAFRFTSLGRVGYWRADREITLNATDVSAIGDLFGSNDATQATAANQAAYSAAGFNGRPCLDYGAGGAKGYVTPSITLGTHTFCFVGQCNAATGYVITQINDGLNGYIFGASAGPAIHVRRGADGSNKNVTAANWLRDGVQRSVTRTFDGTHAGHLAYRNGRVEPATNGAGTADPGTATVAGALYLGCQQTITNALRGLACQWVVFSSAARPDQLVRMNACDRARWHYPA